jgi:CheY-like chemotaxis protein
VLFIDDEESLRSSVSKLLRKRNFDVFEAGDGPGGIACFKNSDPTHIVRSTSTDASGNFRIAFLLPGTYVVRATPPAASGFKPALLAGGLTITTGTETQNQIIVVAP